MSAYRQAAEVCMTKELLAAALFPGAIIEIVGIVQTPADVLVGSYTIVISGSGLPTVPDGLPPPPRMKPTTAFVF